MGRHVVTPYISPVIGLRRMTGVICAHRPCVMMTLTMSRGDESSERLTDPLADSPWSTPSTVAGFERGLPNEVLMRFAAAERERAVNGLAIDIGCGEIVVGSQALASCRAGLPSELVSRRILRGPILASGSAETSM